MSVENQQTSSLNPTSSFQRALLLTGAKIFGIIFSFIIPMYLGRHLEVETYGTYKQVMLIYGFAQLALHLGFDDSVFYFIRWDRKNFPLYSLNSLIFNLLTTGLVALVLGVFREGIAQLLNNPDLAQYLPWLGFLIIFTQCSVQLEGFLINLDRFRTRLYLDAGTELLKALAIMAAFWFFDSLLIALFFLIGLMVLRWLWMLAIMHSHKVSAGIRYRDSWPLFMTQARYGLPLGISRIVQNIMNMENLFISSFFNITQFTYYSVGCFENPLINSARISLYEVANIELIDQVKNKNFKGAVEVWQKMTKKLLLIVIPFTIYMMFFSKELIVFIFSDKYLESVPYFTIFNLYILFASLNPEPLFRSTSHSGAALKLRIGGALLGLSLIFAGAYWGGPMAVLWGKVVATGLVNISGLVIGAKFFKSRVYQLFLWRDIGLTVILSVILSLSVRLGFSNLTWHPFWILAASFSLYFVTLFVFAVRTKLINEEEYAFLVEKLKGLRNRIARLLGREVLRG